MEKVTKLLALPCYCGTLRQISRAATNLYEDAFAGTGLHATQYTALQILDACPGLSTTELGDAMGVDQTTSSRLLGNLRAKKLIQLVATDDRRRRPWALTTLGKATVVKLEPNWLAAGKLFEKHLGREGRGCPQGGGVCRRLAIGIGITFRS